MIKINSLGRLIVRLSEAIKACSIDSDPMKDAVSGMPGADFLCQKTVAKLDELVAESGEESPLLISSIAVHGLTSEASRPDFRVLRTSLADFKTAAKTMQRRLIEEAYAAAGMSIDNPKARSEQLLPRLERRRAELVGSPQKMGWIGTLAFQCTAISTSLGLDETFAEGDLSRSSFVELCVAYKTVTRELRRLEAMARERKAAEERRAAQERNKPAPRPEQKPRPAKPVKTSGF